MMNGDVQEELKDNNEKFETKPDKLLEGLRNRNIHPVLIFGAYNSGKTLFLCSLIDYADRSDLGGVRFVPSDGHIFLPPEDPYAAERNSSANEFFNIVRNFGDGHVPENTKRKLPIFALASLRPVDQSRKKSEDQSITFALMEGNGEWNHYDTTKFSHRESTPEIIKILANFSKPISVIFVAPSCGNIGSDNGVGDKESLAFSYDSVKSSMNLYDKYRDKDFFGKDNLLFLLTKWDRNWEDSQGHLPDGFHNPQLDEIERRFGSISPMPTFKYLGGDPKGDEKKALMVYAAALVKEADPSEAKLSRELPWKTNLRIVRSDDRTNKTIAGFNQKIWNWLYGNATQARFGRRKELGDGTFAERSFGAKVRDKLFGFG